MQLTRLFRSTIRRFASVPPDILNCHRVIIDKLALTADKKTAANLAYAYDVIKHPEANLELLPKILKGSKALPEEVHGELLALRGGDLDLESLRGLPLEKEIQSDLNEARKKIKGFVGDLSEEKYDYMEAEEPLHVVMLRADKIEKLRSEGRVVFVNNAEFSKSMKKWRAYADAGFQKPQVHVAFISFDEEKMSVHAITNPHFGVASMSSYSIAPKYLPAVLEMLVGKKSPLELHDATDNPEVIRLGHDSPRHGNIRSADKLRIISEEMELGIRKYVGLDVDKVSGSPSVKSYDILLPRAPEILS